MKNNIICYFMAIALSIVMNSCTDYPDEYGFIVEMGQTERKVSLSPDGYSITLITPVTYKEITPINNFGYDNGYGGNYIKGHETTCEFVRTGDGQGYISATYTNMEYGNNYELSPFIGNERNIVRGDRVYLNLNKYNLIPKFVSSKISMNANGEIVVEAVFSKPDIYDDLSFENTYIPVKSAQIMFGKTGITPSVSDDGTTVSATLGNPVNIETSNYYIDVVAANDYGNNSIRVGYDFNTYSVTDTYDDDGLKNDCIRLCGMDWAKGNLIVENGKGRIQDNQWSMPENNESSNQAYFNVDELPENPNRNYELKGLPKYDFVTMYYNRSWATPSSEDMISLPNKASRQTCNVELENGEHVYGVLFMSPGKAKRIFTSNTTIYISHKDVDKLGLFLPCAGYYGYAALQKEDNLEDFKYLTSTIRSYYNNSINIFCYMEYSTWYGRYRISSTYASNNVFYPIRPIKLN